MNNKVHSPLNILQEFSIPLFLGVIVALVWANLAPMEYYRFTSQSIISGFSFHFFANEVFMVLFFGIAAVEITQSCLPGGELNPPTRVINPLCATIGGVIGPAVLYLLLNSCFGSPQLNNGWGIPTATDIALAWLAARMIFGKTHPAVSYLLLIAIADDAIGLVIITLFYPHQSKPLEPMWLILVITGIAIALALRCYRIRSYWPYILIGGSLSWTGLYLSGLHPAMALVAIVPFMPHSRHDYKPLFEEDSRDTSTLAQFEREWKVVVDFGLFVFGLANSGVIFSHTDKVTWIVLLSLLIGKTAGVYLFGWIAAKVGFKLPHGLGKRDLLVVGSIAGTGFTVALFVADAAFTDPGNVEAAKMGALFSSGAILLSMILGKVVKVRKCI